MLSDILVELTMVNLYYFSLRNQLAAEENLPESSRNSTVWQQIAATHINRIFN